MKDKIFSCNKKKKKNMLRVIWDTFRSSIQFPVGAQRSRGKKKNFEKFVVARTANPPAKVHVYHVIPY